MYLRLDEKEKNAIAVIENDGNQYTYGELIDFIEEFAGWISKRTLIFIICRNNMGTIAAHAACIENRIVPLMISASMDKELMQNLYTVYSPEYLWMELEFAVENFPGLRPIKKKFGYGLYKTGNDAPEMYEDLSFLLTTSGSTGSPKLVRHSYANIYANPENVWKVFQFTPEDRSWIDLQLNYTMGLNVACSSLYGGAVLLMTTYTAMQKEYWDFFNGYNPTNMTGVPYNYEMLKKLKFFKKKHPGLRIIAEGGGRLSDSLFKEIAEYSKENEIDFYATFGTSETTARLAFLPPEDALTHIGSIGHAIPNGELFLLDDKGNRIEELVSSGEMGYAGPNVTLGYAHCREDLTKEDERHGEYFTGDIAERDKDGYFYIIGRKSRFLKLYSNRVGLDECELMIKENFNTDCACTGTDKLMKIFVTDYECTGKVREFMANKLKLPLAIFCVCYIDQIPKNNVGKTQYTILEQLPG